MEMTDDMVEAFMEKENLLFKDVVPSEVTDWLADDLFGSSQLQKYVTIIKAQTSDIN